MAQTTTRAELHEASTYAKKAVQMDSNYANAQGTSRSVLIGRSNTRGYTCSEGALALGMLPLKRLVLPRSGLELLLHRQYLRTDFAATSTRRAGVPEALKLDPKPRAHRGPRSVAATEDAAPKPRQSLIAPERPLPPYRRLN